MGRTLGVIADRVEAAAHLAEVVANEPLSPQLSRLVLRSDDFTTASFEPCDVTAFRVSRKDFRHYTPAALDQESGELTIIVQRHGDGPGARLIEGWVAGDAVRVCQWSSTRAFHWVRGTGPVVVVGDATVISLVMGASERAEQEGREFRGILGPAAVHLAGHGQSIQRQRKVLIERAGLERRTISTQPYWATGKSGL